MKGEEAKNFFKYLKEHSAQSELTKSIEEKVSFAKKNMTWRKQYMTWQQTIDDEKEDAYEEGLADGISQGIQQGISQGIQQKAVENARNLLTMNLLTHEQIAQAVDLPLEKVKELAEQLRMQNA